MSERTRGIARCSLGRVGIVTGRKVVTYKDGTSALAYTGRHIWPLSWIGKRWSSRSPRWLIPHNPNKQREAGR